MALKVLLDTDIGSDIDDAVCLAYLLAQPDCDLLGITTVTGEPVKRAMLASALCRVAGREVPIYPGAADPLLIAPRQPQAPQSASLPRWAHDIRFPSGETVEFMRRIIRQHPGEVTLLAIGPLTNVALLFAADPEIPALLKSLVLMCGVFLRPELDALEWNAILDPHAATIVYRARPPLHRSIGLDVTTQVVMNAPEVRARFDRPLLRPVLDFAEVWFAQRPEITFHDPLAAATLFEPSLCGYQSGTVTIELSAQERLGQTVWQASAAPGAHEVAVSVDAPRFFDHYFGVFRA